MVDHQKVCDRKNRRVCRGLIYHFQKVFRCLIDNFLCFKKWSWAKKNYQKINKSLNFIQIGPLQQCYFQSETSFLFVQFFRHTLLHTSRKKNKKIKFTARSIWSEMFYMCMKQNWNMMSFWFCKLEVFSLLWYEVGILWTVHFCSHCRRKKS